MTQDGRRSGGNTPGPLDDALVVFEDDLTFDDDLVAFLDDDRTQPVVVIPGAPEGSSRGAMDSAAYSVPREPWHVLLVDDDPDVLLVTRMALEGLDVSGTPVHLHVAHSAADAKRLLTQRADFALMVTDVVMEHDRAGLELVRWVRERDPLAHMRLVIRTGEPGQAPESSVLESFDINDYWPKTELTAHRMRTLVVGLLRSFRDLVVVERQKEDLRTLVHSIGTLASLRGTAALVETVLRMIESTYGLGAEMTVLFLELPQHADVRQARLLDATSDAARHAGRPVGAFLEADLLAMLERSAATGTLVEANGRAALLLSDDDTSGSAFIAMGVEPLAPWARSMLTLLCSNALAILNGQRHLEERERLTRAAKRFVPDCMVRWLGHTELTQLSWGDHLSSRAWVLFCDIRAFTKRSESLSPDAVHQFLLACFDAIVPAIERHGGVIDKFLGDGLMALFPMTEPPPLAACIEASDAIHRAFDGTVEIGIGLHGGDVLLCTLGHKHRIDVTAVADTVNVASRIESATRAHGCEVLLSDTVAAAVPADSPLRDRLIDRGARALRGRRGDTTLYQLVTNRELARS